jgi:hypothetical protein
MERALESRLVVVVGAALEHRPGSSLLGQGGLAGRQVSFPSEAGRHQPP